MPLFYNQTISDISGGPPPNPSTGDIWIASNVDTTGSRWSFQYNSGSTSPYKWEFIGGAPVIRVTNTVTHPSASNVWQETDTTLRFTVVRPGDYQMMYSVQFSSTTGGILGQVALYDVTATTAADNNAGTSSGINGWVSLTRTVWVSQPAANHVYSQAQQTNDTTAANTSYYNKSMTYVPIRIS